MEFQLKTWVARMLAANPPSVDAVEGNTVRVSRYDEIFVQNAVPKKYPTITGGEYRVASLAPGATALQLGLSASWSATAACIVLYNTDSVAAASNKRCYLDYIRFVVTTPPTSATALWGATFLDSSNRSPTTVVAEGGTPATVTAYTPAVSDPNMDNGQPNIVGKPFFPLSTSAGAAPTIPGASTAVRRIVGNIPIRGQIPVAGDEYVIDFGSVDAPGGALVTAAPAGASKVVVSHPGIVIGAGQTFIFYMWGPSNATAGIAFSGLDMGWWER